MTTKEAAESKRVRVKAVVESLEALGLDMTKQDHPLVYRKDTERGSVIFYPSSGKWQHRGKTISGSIEEFKNWMKEKGFV